MFVKHGDRYINAKHVVKFVKLVDFDKKIYKLRVWDAAPLTSKAEKPYYDLTFTSSQALDKLINEIIEASLS